MWVRAGLGAVAILVGVVWVLQGLDVAKGSGMSGHPIWAVFGALLLLVGIVLLRAADALRRRRS